MNKRPSYREAILWIVLNDDTQWVDDASPISVTAVLVADLFGKSDECVRADIKRALAKERVCQ